ncbi:uncharacterized protein LOC118446383 [Vespa mandarinia]|uniref:uncharacterized protein LOC118446383 n=1 Tax=Vespa mandarinia TaxID=7446 RepID=UPI00160F3D4C|nr:uncharacterized protein LOC118446383 [Vespa mandarinia]
MCTCISLPLTTFRMKISPIFSRSRREAITNHGIERSVEEKHVRGRYQWNASTSINGLVSWSIWESVSPEVAKILTIKESEREKEVKREKEKECFTRECPGNVFVSRRKIVIIVETIERGMRCASMQ